MFSGVFLVKFWGLFGFCKHALPTDHRDDQVTMSSSVLYNPLCPTCQLQRQAEGFDVNGLQKERWNSLANVPSNWSLIPGDVRGRVEYLYVWSPACVPSFWVWPCTSFHKEGKPFSPSLEAGLVLGLGSQEQMAEGVRGWLWGHAPALSLGPPGISPEQPAGGRKTVKRTDKAPELEGTPNRPAPRRRAPNHRHIREPCQDQKNGPCWGHRVVLSHSVLGWFVLLPKLTDMLGLQPKPQVQPSS